MKALSYADLVDEASKQISELFPWDLVDLLQEKPDLLLVDIREPHEFEPVQMENSINVPRGTLESACEWDYDETVPELASGHEREIILICRSGHRSALAAVIMQRMGYAKVHSLKTGIRGWFEYEQPLIDNRGEAVDEDFAEDFFTTKLQPEQRNPARRR